MENIIEYYVIIGLSFIITSYIITYRPAMRLVAEELLKKLNSSGANNEFLLYKVKIFTSFTYRALTLSLYLVIIFILYPVASIVTLFRNDMLINGFYKGIINGLLTNE